MTVALCLLTLNEIEGCQHDIPLLDRSQFDQIYCLDGGSTDGTIDYLEGLGIPVYRQKNKGLNNACKEGVAYCKCDSFVFFHPKGTVPVEDTYKFREYFEQGYKLVVASRMIKGAKNEEDSHLIRPRKWFVLSLGLCAKVLFQREGNTIWDVLHGFRGMVLKEFNMCEISDQNPSVDIEMVCRSYKLKLPRIEFPTKEGSRISGETHFKAIPTGKKLIKYMFWEWRRK